MRAAAPPARNSGGSADDGIVVDYARGGGSSGARLSECGASGANGGSTAKVDASARVGVRATLSAAGEHGAMVWQPFGAQGNRQGDCWSLCCDGEAAA